MTFPYGGLLNTQVKRKVFISYHHKDDQVWYDRFQKIFCNLYDCFTDRALNEPVRSDDSEYVHRKIREDFISGSSCTAVLCGANTFKRKYVDWEIHSTLHYGHGLLGILLPSVHRSGTIWSPGPASVPDRLYENIQSGYATYIDWTDDPNVIRSAVEQSISNAKFTDRIRNAAPQMTRNAS